MSWFERTLLTIFTFIVCIIAIVAFPAFLGWEAPIRLVQQGLSSSEFQSGGLLLSGFLALAGIKILTIGLHRKSVAHTIIKDTPMGQINISTEAVENLVLKTAQQFSGIKEVRPRIITEKQGIAVIIKVVVTSDVNIPELLDQLQLKVKEYLAEVGGIQVNRVKILVTSISGTSLRSRVE